MHVAQYIMGLSLSIMLSAAHATDLPIGPVSLSLGMDQSTVMKELHERFE